MLKVTQTGSGRAQNLGLTANALVTLSLRKLRGRRGRQGAIASVTAQSGGALHPTSARGESPSFLFSVRSPSLARAELTGRFYSKYWWVGSAWDRKGRIPSYRRLGEQAVTQGGISYHNISKCHNEFPGQYLLPTVT